MAASIHDRLIQHLSQGDLFLAEQDLQRGALFQPKHLERALGPAHSTPAAQQVQVFDWLLRHQQPLPSPTAKHAVKVMLNDWLLHRPVALLDRAQMAGYVFEPNEGGIFNALRRPDADGLVWWQAQGLPMVLPDLFEQSLLSASLSLHRFQALPQVRFLWERGFRPHPSEPAPLRELAQWHRDAKKEAARYAAPPPTPADTEGFRALWLYLVSVGNDPNAPDSKGVRPADVVAQSPSAAWYQALSGSTIPVPPRRPRPR